MNRTGTFHWTKHRFIKAVSDGLFGNAKAEFLGGEVYLMTPKREHIRCGFNLERLLKAVLPAGDWFVSRESCIELAGGLPLPDIAILRGPEGDQYSRARGMPTERDVVLIAEVSERTYRKDRTKKLPRYADAGIPVYWIVSIKKRQVEVFWQPRGQGSAATYVQSAIYKEGQEVPVVIDGAEAGRIAVADILEEV
jgi:Uma2 family endonuclease